MAKQRYYDLKAAGQWVRKERTTDANCAWCGTTFSKTLHRTKYCTQACYLAHRKSQYVAKPPHKRTWIAGTCIICDESFVSKYKDVTCSAECQAANKANGRRNRDFNRRGRKSKAFVATVHRDKVFEWDGYRCHLCGGMTDRTKTVPHPKAPTVDHVIPLASGGTHEPTNCRTACFLCNVVKQNQGGGEQHVLFA
jgi:5-methylcytosine-specific restriction endonuclease McrA